MTNQFFPQDNYELEKLLTTMLCLKIGVNEYQENSESYFRLYVCETGDFVEVFFEKEQPNTWNDSFEKFHQFTTMTDFVNWLNKANLTK